MSTTEDEGVLELMVASMSVAAEGVLAITLADPEGGYLPAWTPGSHIDLGLPEMVRQYSLCGDPADRERYIVAVLQEQVSRGGSSYVHEELRPGELVEVGGPRNHFELAPAKEYLFIAGGIGITPILAMVRQAEADRVPWRLVYGGRTLRSMAFREELARYGDRVSFCPEDTTGRLDLATLLAAPGEGLTVYCCGPSGLLDAVEASSADWPSGTVNFERFVARDVSSLPSEPVSVHCDRSGVTLQVGASESILDVLEQAGIGVANACRTGVCGSCEVPVLAGIPDHRDSIRAGAELDDCNSIAVCISRARTPELTLDV